MSSSVGFGGGRVMDFYTTTSAKPQTQSQQTSSSSGEICPQSGAWKNTNFQVVVGVSKGDVMPQYQNRNVSWELTEFATADVE